MKKQLVLSIPIFKNFLKDKQLNINVDRLMDYNKELNDKEDFKSFVGVLAEDEEWDDIEKILEKARQIPRKSLDTLNLEKI